MAQAVVFRPRWSSDGSAHSLSTRPRCAASRDLGVSFDEKLESVAVQLVGAGLGDAWPIVSLLYDGTSRLRACQPKIEAVVERVGEDVTSFGEITELEVVGRSVSPVAGVNAFPDDANGSLGRRPVASPSPRSSTRWRARTPESTGPDSRTFASGSATATRNSSRRGAATDPLPQEDREARGRVQPSDPAACSGPTRKPWTCM
jgi:hypothetical protein